LRSKQAEVPSHHAAPEEALDVARYVTDMAARLEAMAVAARLGPLACFLRMVKAEGDLFIRGNTQADSPETDNDNPLD
jgi:hypothetical protein